MTRNLKFKHDSLINNYNILFKNLIIVGTCSITVHSFKTLAARGYDYMINSLRRHDNATITIKKTAQKRPLI